MASITITVPDAVQTRVLDAVAAKTGWTAGSGLTKAQWARQQIAQFIKGLVVAYEADAARDAAYIAQLNTTTTEVDIT